MSERLDQLMFEGRTVNENFAELKEQIGDIIQKQWGVATLDQISSDAGVLEAGEFRSGIGTPGTDFTGIRMGFPSFVYDGVEWNIVGVNVDVLQFGLRASDGVALWGGGAGLLDVNGMKLDISTTRFENLDRTIRFLDFDDTNKNIAEFGGFVSAVSDTAHFVISINEDDDYEKSELLIEAHGDVVSIAKMRLFVTDAGGAEGAYITLSPSASGRDAINIFGQASGAGLQDYVVINENGGDMDFRVEGDTKTDLLKVDAGIEQVSIGGFFSVPRETKTISSGAITITQSGIIVTAESAGVDNLDTLTGGNDNDILYLQATSGHVITVRDGVGNINTGANRVLTGSNGSFLVLKNWGGSNWYQLSYAAN